MKNNCTYIKKQLSYINLMGYGPYPNMRMLMIDDNGGVKQAM